MNNEPVAWGWYDLEIKKFFPHWDEDLMENKEGCIPLYTHPAKESKAKDRFSNYESICLQCGTTIYKPSFKTLTDEEIKFIAHPFESVYTTYDKQTDTDTIHTRFDQLGFARAILRKAQEK
jgi:hypothetical protein